MLGAPQGAGRNNPTSGFMRYNTLMQDSEATSPPLCGLWDQSWVDPLQQAHSTTPTSMFESGIQHTPHPSSSPPTLANLGDASSPPGPHISSDFSYTPLQLHDLETLEGEVESLHKGLSGNAAALQLLTEIQSRIRDFAWVDEADVNDFVVCYDGLFYCPSPTCARNLEGWDRPDRARDHIWAEHLGRYYLCLWDGCSRTFKQHQECSTHIRKKHRSNGEEFVCRICAKVLAAKYNLNRHMRDTHQLPTQPRTRRIVNRLRN